MNIKITHNWLLEYLKTDASPYEIQKYLSLCGPSVERVEKVKDDYTLEIEITSNRVDSASVFGIAQEAYAILPRFDKKAQLIQNPLTAYAFGNLKAQGNKSLQVKIVEPNICSRFTALILSNVHIGPSPKHIQKRLTDCGIKSINNVIDISNYLMVALGQPTHVFDYDKIGKSQMIMRLSKKGEELVTLDEKKVILPGGDIVIEDGNGNLIDLCGIMGGLSSSVTADTKNIILFIQTYNKNRIRRTSMLTGTRTVAATFFEKGLDEERVEPTLVYGVELLKKYANAVVDSTLYDIYAFKQQPMTIDISQEDIDLLIGIPIDAPLANSFLTSLGFSVIQKKEKNMTITVPSYRKNDVSLKEDIIEEIARVYGYFNLPDNLQLCVYIKQPKEMHELFMLVSKIKLFLKHRGLHETINYSMISKNQITTLGESAESYLKIINSISEEITYMRRSLIPSLIKNIAENEGKRDMLGFFEIAKVYIPKEQNLPDEVYKLGITVNSSFFNLKGIVESLFTELHIDDISFKQSSKSIFSNQQADIYIDSEKIGTIGALKSNIRSESHIKKESFFAEIEMKSIIAHYKSLATYQPINSFAIIKLDLTFQLKTIAYEQIKKIAFETSPFLMSLELLSHFNKNITLRFYFQDKTTNITEGIAKAELDKIKKKIT